MSQISIRCGLHKFIAFKTTSRSPRCEDCVAVLAHACWSTPAKIISQFNVVVCANRCILLSSHERISSSPRTHQYLQLCFKLSSVSFILGFLCRGPRGCFWVNAALVKRFLAGLHPSTNAEQEAGQGASAVVEVFNMTRPGIEPMIPAYLVCVN